MKIRSLVLLAALVHAAAFAQFPFLRTLEVRPGQQRPAISCIVQDAMGLLWVGADMGLLRTDGERVDVIVRTENDPITALAPDGNHVLAAFHSGLVLRCIGDRCDTILRVQELQDTPIRALSAHADGRICLATYGAGIWILDNGTVTKLGAAQGLPDDHVNDLALLPDDRLVVATDQGLAVCAGGRVVELLDGSRGAPDNLVLSVCATEQGEVWAGTDQRGVFRWRPGTAGVHVLDSAWSHGPVISLAAAGDHIWAGTQQQGVILHDTRYKRASYRQHEDQHGRAMDLFVDREGVAWWCDLTDRLYRADPAILFVPEHEGLDLRSITALCTDAQGRIWFATAAGLFHHAAAFSEELEVTRVPLQLDPRTPIVSLTAAANGTIWAATFGSGVVAVRPGGDVERYTTRDGLGNDNVLAVRASGDAVWFATLQGITRWKADRFEAFASEAGFVFDVLPMTDGTVFLATDGHGLLHWNGTLKAPWPDGPRTYYSVVPDAKGAPWVAGPGTGLCRVGTLDAADPKGPSCMGQGRAPFNGDLYAVGNSLGRLVAFGSTGVAALDPIHGSWVDLTARFGLQDMQAQLNVITTDAVRAIWVGCNKGLVRIRPTDHHFDPQVPVIITGMLIDGDVVPVTEEFTTTHDRNDITIRFTALYYTDPAAVRFDYRVAGQDGKILRTRDREVTLSGLAPGRHPFQVRAFVGEPGRTDEWRTITIIVEPPWWQVPWVIAAASVAFLLALFLLIRMREQRIRYRDSMEKEQVRFQLEALRSQVDPHFLFNSFNTLVELIEEEPGKAVEHVEQMSTFFRNILLVRDMDLHTVSEELRLLQTYFALEQRRFGAAIHLSVVVPEDQRAAQIVPLTLQLLVENAIKHNVATEDAPLNIRVAVEDGCLVVSNPIRPRLSPARSTAFGLDSIHKRYAAFTQRRIDVSTADGIFCVRIPLIDQKP